MNPTSARLSFTFLRHLRHSSPMRGPGQRRSSQANTSFIGSLLSNIKEEFSKSKEIKDNIAKFREEAQRLEQSEALQEARRKYRSLEKDTIHRTHYVRQKVDEFGTKFLESDIARQVTDVGGRVQKQIKATMDTMSTGMEKSETVKKLSSTVHEIQEQIEDVASLNERLRMYSKPETVRKRSELAITNDMIDSDIQQRQIKDNPTATNIVLHKDWSWYESWQNFKDNNSYIHKIFEFKTRYDESDNTLIRATRYVTSTVSDKIGSMFFSKNELSEALDEIYKIDSSFNLQGFMRQIEREIAPNVLGALSANRMDVLRDWCHEAVFNVLSHDIKQAESSGNQYHLTVFDIGEVEFAASKVMDQGPIVVVTFQTQQLQYVTDSKGTVQLGSKNKLKSVLHVWALCRDQSIPDPHACWRLIDMTMQERGELAL